MRDLPEQDYFPDTRHPGVVLRDVRRYVGMPVAITYRPRSMRPDDKEAIIKGRVRGVLSGPPRLVLEIRGEDFKLLLDRVASITIIHDV